MLHAPLPRLASGCTHSTRRKLLSITCQISSRNPCDPPLFQYLHAARLPVAAIGVVVGLLTGERTYDAEPRYAEPHRCADHRREYGSDGAGDAACWLDFVVHADQAGGAEDGSEVGGFLPSDAAGAGGESADCAAERFAGGCPGRSHCAGCAAPDHGSSLALERSGDGYGDG